MQKLTKLQKRKYRVRSKIYGTGVKPRLSVYRSNKHIYAQIVDDETGTTLCSADDLKIKEKDNLTSAKKVGEMIAKEATKKKVREVVFDRNGRKFHGRIKALATGAREQGLKF